MLRSARAEFEALLAGALEAEGLAVDDLGLEEPPADVDAIVASSVAFRLAGELGREPAAVAADLAGAIDPAGARHVGGVEAVGPYVNVRPSEAYHVDTLESARAPGFGRLPARDESVVVEHTSANPTGPIHIGRARNPIIGDALARVLDAAGHDVAIHYYVNDAGRQMALFTWAYETIDGDELPPPERDRAEYDLVRYYRAGTARLEAAEGEDAAAIEAEIESIMHGLEAGDEAVYERVGAVVDAVLGGMRECLRRLPAEFDAFVKETRFMRDGSTADVVARLKDLPEADLDDGAWQLDLSSFGIDKEFVFTRSDGTSLYTTRDLAHHEWKFDRFDRAITVLGEDQQLHANQLRAALELLGHDTDGLEEVLYGYVNLPGGEGMSTRRGTGVNLDDLLDEAIVRARAEVERRLDDRTRGDDLDEAAIDAIAEDVGIGAVRFDIVSTQPTKTILFEWDRALDFEAQSAPYVQYAHARCCGILERADGAAPDRPAAPSHPSEVALCETVAAYPYAVERAADGRAPHRVAAYLLTLADDFNAFYRDCPVLDAGGATLGTRLALVEASRRTLADGLGLLGVAAPESM